VLQEAGKAMNCQEMIEVMAAKGYLEFAGRQDARGDSLHGDLTRGEGEGYRGAAQENRARHVRAQTVDHREIRSRGPRKGAYFFNTVVSGKSIRFATRLHRIQHSRR
jgi:hypothetical protein